MGTGRLDEALAAAIGRGDSGAFEARDQKKRWVVWLEGGQLVGHTSNLKGETLDALKESRPELSDAGLRSLQAIRRLRAAFLAPEWDWRPGEAPAERAPGATVGVYLKALAAAFTEDNLLGRLPAGGFAWDPAGGGLTGLDLPKDLTAWLGASPPLGLAPDALLASAPGKRPEAMAALLLLWGADRLQPATAAAPSAPPPAAAAGALDLAALFASVPAAATPAPPPAPRASSGGFDASGFLSARRQGNVDAVPSAPHNPANDPVYLDDIGVEVAGDALPAAHTTAPSFPSLRAASPEAGAAPPAAPPLPAPVLETVEVAPRHPLEDTLRDIHRRVMADGVDHFTVLGVEWSAGAEAFRKAHLELARVLHPDRYADADVALQALATEAFDRVRAAWEVLGDPAAAAAYIDRVIHGNKTEEEQAMEAVQAYYAAESDFKRGLAAFNQGMTKAAHEHFSSALAKVPDELEFQAYQAFTSFQLLRASQPEVVERSKDILKAVIEKNKDQQRKLDAAWVLLGRIYRETGGTDAAKKCFVAALKINPANADATREMRRLTGGAPGQPAARKDERGSAPAEKPPEGGGVGGFFSRLFGKK